MRCYLAGAMSGHEDFNFPAFRAAAADLRSQGHEVISPVELDEEEGFSPTDDCSSSDYAHFLSRDIQVIAGRGVEAIVVLSGWQGSGGAMTEVAFGRALKLPILVYPTLMPIDSAEVRVVDPKTGGTKGQKLSRFDLLPYDALARIAEVYGYGVGKYEARNWERGYAWGLSFAALQRHLAAFWNGEGIDPESGLPHLAHAGFHVLALLHFSADERYREHDDRPRKD